MKKILLLLMMMFALVPMALAEKIDSSLCNFDEENFPVTFPFMMKYVHGIQDKWQPSKFMGKNWDINGTFKLKIDRTGKVHWVKFEEGEVSYIPFFSKAENYKKFFEDIYKILSTTSPGPFPKEFEEDELIIEFKFTYVPYTYYSNWSYYYVWSHNVFCGVPLDKNDRKLSFYLAHNSKVRRGFFPRKPLVKGEIKNTNSKKQEK